MDSNPSSPLVVSDASTLIHLSKIGHLSLLETFFAEIYGLNKVGVVGLLIRASREQRIDSLKVELDKLRGQAGFWIEDRLYYHALSVVGET